MQYSKADLDNFTPKIRLAEADGHDLTCGLVVFDPTEKWVVTDELFESFYRIPEFGARYEIYDRYNPNAKNPNQLLCVKRADYQHRRNNEFLISLEEYVEESDRLRRVHQVAPIPSTQWEEKFIENAAKRLPHVFYGNDLGIDIPNPFSKFLETVPYRGWLTENVVEGLTSFFSYIGMAYTTFNCHVEDLMSYSINVHLFGEPKIWISIDPSYTTLFEACLRRDFAERIKNLSCEEFLQHKDLFISPDYLREHKIPFFITPQFPGQIVVTFPRGYHWGWNQGLNINIAANFVLEKWFYYWRRWIKEGIWKACSCPVRNPEFGDSRIPATLDLNAKYCDNVYERLVSTQKTPTMPGSYEIPEWLLQRRGTSLQSSGTSEESDEDHPGTSSGIRRPLKDRHAQRALESSFSTLELGSSASPTPSSSHKIAPGRGRKPEPGGSFVCKTCGLAFNRIDSLSRHKKSHEPDRFRCHFAPLGCQYAAPRADQKKQHESKCPFK